MDSRIEDYFDKTLTDESRAAFELEVSKNRELADEVAFYLAARQAQRRARKERLEKSHAEWSKLPVGNEVHVNWKQWLSVAAVVLLLSFGVFRMLQNSGTDYQRLAHEYVSKELNSYQSNQMGNATDSLQQAIQLYNRGKLNEAGDIAESLLNSNSNHAESIKLLGIVSLKQGHYDKAIGQFRALGNMEGLYSNPGRFYEGLALMERNLPGDVAAGEKLFNEVVEKDLEGKKVVEEWRN